MRKNFAKTSLLSLVVLGAVTSCASLPPDLEACSKELNACQTARQALEKELQQTKEELSEAIRLLIECNALVGEP